MGLLIIQALVVLVSRFNRFKIHKEFRCVAGNKRNETRGSRFIRNRVCMRFRSRASLQILSTRYRAETNLRRGRREMRRKLCNCKSILSFSRDRNEYFNDDLRLIIRFKEVK